MTTSVQVFDPAMCCSTGVCGPSIDPALMRFAADLEWLGEQGVQVQRFNLSQEPAAFAAQPIVLKAIEVQGESALPAILVGGVLKSTGAYPSREQLAAWAAAPASEKPVVAKGGCGCGPTGCC